MATSKEQRINDLERDIEKFVKRYADENTELKKENDQLRQNQSNARSEEEIKAFKSQTAQKIDEITSALESNMLQNQQLQEHLDK